MPALRPSLFPEFSFGWLEVISHRFLLPKLILAPEQQGWPLLHTLLLDVLKFMKPFLVPSTGGSSMTDAIRMFYKGTLRVFLLLLHDFPEFLSAYYWSLCNDIPNNCVQLRNLI